MFYGQSDLLSGNDALLMLETIEQCLLASDENAFQDTIFPAMRKLFHFEFASAILGIRCVPQQSWVCKGFVGVNLTPEFNDCFVRLPWLDDVVIREHFANSQLQYWSCANQIQMLLGTGERRHNASIGPCGALAMDFGIRSGYTCGVVPARPGGLTSMISFSSGMGEILDPRVREILHHLAPHLHQALVRYPPQQDRPPAPMSLSLREREVLNWLKVGKSSWDISVLLGISERTVNFHVANLLRKLGALNRPQAVAIAVSNGLVPLD
ncbi:MAG: hypothetical protein F8N37_17955 [Telmatospirillum sp.]|nr:hypothetical protein [Telmatospirillum sp.]